MVYERDATSACGPYPTSQCIRPKAACDPKATLAERRCTAKTINLELYAAFLAKSRRLLDYADFVRWGGYR